jgi:hypothetical protein
VRRIGSIIEYKRVVPFMRRDQFAIRCVRCGYQFTSRIACFVQPASALHVIASAPVHRNGGADDDGTIYLASEIVKWEQMGTTVEVNQEDVYCRSLSIFVCIYVCI